MSFLMILFKWHLRFIYFFLKLLPTNQQKVILLSRQFSSKTLDYALIEVELNKEYPDYKVVIITKKLEKKILSMISYYFSMYRQMYHLATSIVCITDSYCIPVSILNHKNTLTNIHLCHGIGTFKKFGYQALKKDSSNKKRFSKIIPLLGGYEKVAKIMQMHYNYDYLISTSKESSKHYAKAFNMDIRKMLNFGPPKIDYILNIKSKKDEVLAKYPNLKDKPLILYVSTFRTYKDDYLDKFIKAMPLDKYNVIIHLHPVIYSLYPEMEEKLNVPGLFKCQDIQTVDLLSIIDYAVTDFSSFMFEPAIAKIPTYLYVADYNKYVINPGLNIDLFKELPNYVFKDAKDVFKAIEAGNYNYRTLEKFRKKHVENVQGNSTKKLIDLMIKGKIDPKDTNKK